MIRLLVENILKHPKDFEWSVQGLGMMRVYLSQAVRLHIWDSALKVPGVSPLHTHPWDMTSTVVAGRYKQHRYFEDSDPMARELGEEFNVVTIKCGENACTMEEPKKVRLIEAPLEIYKEGASYFQNNNEIHLSCPEDGTVTLVERTFKADRDHAKVFWRGKGDWVDAKPRPAEPHEVQEVTDRALRIWF